MLEKLKELRDFCIMQQARWTNDMIECGDFTYGVPIIHKWDKTTRLKIGKFCSIGGNVQILLGGEHHTEWITTYPFDVFMDDGVAKSKGDVIIGNDVWIGDDVMIMSGVTIGDGAVIGAKALVTKDVQAYEIVGGVPTHHIRWRFGRIHEAVRAWRLSWWDWPIEKIAEAYTLLRSGNIDMLEEFDRRWNDGLRGDA